MLRKVTHMPFSLRTAAVPLLALGLLAACAGPGTRDPAALANASLAAGRVDDAVREIELAVRQRPRDPALRRQAAHIYTRADELERAVVHLEVALQLAPSDPEISVQLGTLEQRRGNLPDAYVAFRRAAELAPDDLRAVSGLALSAEALGFEEEAAASYARWAELERELGLED
jgi:Flp pilus assembly protein TadD